MLIGTGKREPDPGRKGYKWLSGPGRHLAAPPSSLITGAANNNSQSPCTSAVDILGINHKAITEPV
jgi:hypothetical protein